MSIVVVDGCLTTKTVIFRALCTSVLNGSENGSNWKISSASPQNDDAVTNDDAVEMQGVVQGVDVVPSSWNGGSSRSSMLIGRPLMTLSERLLFPR